MKVRIESDPGEANLIVIPLDFNFSEMPKVRIYLKHFEGAKITGGKISIPLQGKDADDTYNRLRAVLAKGVKCEVELAPAAKKVVGEAEREAEKFAIFSKKALSIRNNRCEKEDLDNFTNILLSGNFQRKLKVPYQLLSAYHLAFSQNACNFSVPGAGKTTTVLAAFEYLKTIKDENKKVEKLLVISPLAAFMAWKDEFEACFGRPPKVLEIRGGVKSEAIEDALSRSNVAVDLIIASYGSIANKLDVLQFFLKNNKTMVVLDEAHRIKKVDDGVQSLAALQLSKYAKARVVLTGTPAANSYADLNNIFKFIWPENNIVGYSVAQLNNIGKRFNDPRAKDLIKRISPFFIRIKKSDLKLPEPTFNAPKIIKMSPVQQLIYDEISASCIKRMQGAIGESANIFRRSAAIRMRQAATNPSLLSRPLDDYFAQIGEGSYQNLGIEGDLAMSDTIIDLVRKYRKLETPQKFLEAEKLAKHLIARGEKLLIWCEFVGTCDDLKAHLEQAGIKVRILYGSTAQEERDEIVHKFGDVDNAEFRVVIANPHAVGESISLHKGCHNALYLEQSFDAGVYMQSKDRIHRVGLKPGQDTNYFFFQSSGTVDEVIFSRILEKERKMLDIIENEEIPLLSGNADFLEDTTDDIKAIIIHFYNHQFLAHFPNQIVILISLVPYFKCSTIHKIRKDFLADSSSKKSWVPTIAIEQFADPVIQGMAINLRCRATSMAEHFLSFSYCRAASFHVGAKRVS